jgi:hypothetical protein
VRRRRIRALALVAAWAGAAAAGAEAGIETSLTRTADGYAFRGAFVARASRECLLDVVYRLEHLRRFAGEDVEVSLAGEGDGWHDVRYRSTGWLHRLDLVYRKTLDRARARVGVRLVSARQSGMVPRILASEGGYALEVADGETRVVYEERVTLAASLLRGAYARRADGEGRRLIERLREHALAACP